MKIQFHGHACFSIFTSEGAHLLIDPFLDENPLAKIKSETLSPDVILLTHGHWDHIGDTLKIAKRTNALIIANAEIASYYQLQGLTNLHGMNLGGGFQFPFGYVKMVPALHSSGITQDGKIIYLGNPAGFLLKIEGKTIYHAGDTALSHEMTLLGNANRIDYALLPIGGNFTMDTNDAILAAKALRARHVIPMHYDTFPVIAQNPSFYANQLLNYGIPCSVLQPEEILEVQ